jgi:hypothetical protein
MIDNFKLSLKGQRSKMMLSQVGSCTLQSPPIFASLVDMRTAALIIRDLMSRPSSEFRSGEGKSLTSETTFLWILILKPSVPRCASHYMLHEDVQVRLPRQAQVSSYSRLINAIEKYD